MTHLFAVLSANVFTNTRADGSEFDAGSLLLAEKAPDGTDTGRNMSARVAADKVAMFSKIVGHLVKADGEIVLAEKDGVPVLRADHSQAWNLTKVTKWSYVGPQGPAFEGFPT